MIQNKCNLIAKLTAKENLKGKINNAIIKEYPELEDLKIIPTSEQQTFKSNKYGYDTVYVHAINMQEKTIIPKSEKQEITADSNYSGLSKVSIEGDNNLIPENIKNNVSIFGINGVFEGNDEKYFDGKFYGGGSNTGCNLATAITGIQNIDTQNITNMSYMFYNCKSLKKIPLIDTSNATNMNSMFQYCLSLETIPKLNTSNVTVMGNMFTRCTSLINIPLIDTKKVTNMAYTFSECSNLRDVPVLDTSSATSMSYMFNQCGSLTDESLNNIMEMCINAVNITNKTLKHLNLSSTQRAKCKTLSNYQAFLDAGWTTE